MSSSNESTRANTLDGASTHKEPLPHSPDRSTTQSKVPLNYFDKEGSSDLSRRLSRTQSSLSTASFRTQDPTGDNFEYKQHLRAILRRGEKAGIVNRELGVSFEGLRVTGAGNGLAYGPSMGEIGYGITHAFAKKSALHFFSGRSITDPICADPTHPRSFSRASLDPSSRSRCCSFWAGKLNYSQIDASAGLVS